MRLPTLPTGRQAQAGIAESGIKTAMHYAFKGEE